MEGCDRFLRVLDEAPPPCSRPRSPRQVIHDSLETALREETGAAGDPPPGLMAGQIRWTRQPVFVGIGREMLAGHKPAEVSREVLVLADDIEDLLSEKVLNYAVRGVQ